MSARRASEELFEEIGDRNIGVTAYPDVHDQGEKIQPGGDPKCAATTLGSDSRAHLEKYSQPEMRNRLEVAAVYLAPK